MISQNVANFIFVNAMFTLNLFCIPVFDDHTINMHFPTQRLLKNLRNKLSEDK